MATIFDVTPHDTFGIECCPERVNLQIQVASTVSLNSLDTKDSLITKLKTSGRIKSAPTADDFEVQRDGDIIHVFAADAIRSRRILLAELIKRGVEVPLEIKRTPDRDGDDLNLDDMGD